MSVRFHNARILKNPAVPEIIHGEVHIIGGRIIYAGETENAPRNETKFAREIDVRGNLLMPGFNNAHSHSPMTFLRSYADDLPLDKWLYERVFPLEAKLAPEHVYAFTKVAILEYIAGGITSAFDMYYEPEAIVQACTELGFRLVLCGAVNDFKESVKKLGEYYGKFNHKHPLVSYRLGFHAEYTTSTNLLRELSELAEEKKAPVFAHNSETAKEVADCIERHGKTPTELFHSLGLFRHGGGGFHCVHLTENDIDILKNNKVHVITNPASNLKLASGIAPVQKLLDNGINVALGTDGPAGNNALNMWREMYLATALQKGITSDAAACPAEKALGMATTNSAMAMGLRDCGTLETDKQADIIMIDLNRPNMQPVNNIVKNLVYSGSDSNVKLTMISGRILYENGEFFVGEDPESIYGKANEMVKEICGKGGEFK